MVLKMVVRDGISIPHGLVAGGGRSSQVRSEDHQFTGKIRVSFVHSSCAGFSKGLHGLVTSTFVSSWCFSSGHA